ncbi:MAG TPA: IS1595 family transposase [Dehalococcoidia bacterium]|nr:IS1595 family transposase [Dehalococcoidia bacterium]
MVATTGVNLMTLLEQYGTEDKCREVLEGLRWPTGVQCPRCAHDKVYRDEKRSQYDCADCGYQFSVTSGTVLHDTHLPLRKWFVAAYLMTESRKGISANQLKRMISVSYKTAWYLCHRIRAAMKDAAPVPLTGVIEFDETFLGGKKKGIGKGNTRHLTTVLGALERGGNVRLKVSGRRNKKALHAFVSDVADDTAEAFYTDDFQGYTGIGDANTRHESVDHKAEEWVRGDVHTNSVEGVWSLLKRSIVGSYHQMSAKHLPAYLDEFAFRFNNRHSDTLFRDTLMKLVESDALPYQDLIAS